MGARYTPENQLELILRHKWLLGRFNAQHVQEALGDHLAEFANREQDHRQHRDGRNHLSARRQRRHPKSRTPGEPTSRRVPLLRGSHTRRGGQSRQWNCIGGLALDEGCLLCHVGTQVWGARGLHILTDLMGCGPTLGSGGKFLTGQGRSSEGRSLWVACIVVGPLQNGPTTIKTTHFRAL